MALFVLSFNLILEHSFICSYTLHLGFISLLLNKHFNDVSNPLNTPLKCFIYLYHSQQNKRSGGLIRFFDFLYFFDCFLIVSLWHNQISILRFGIIIITFDLHRLKWVVAHNNFPVDFTFFHKFQCIE